MYRLSVFRQQIVVHSFMDRQIKFEYQAPAAVVLELSPERLVCDSPNRVLWILAGEPANTLGSDTEWDRSGYGTAEDF